MAPVLTALLPIALWASLASAFPPKKFQYWFRSWSSGWFKDAERACQHQIYRYHNDIREGSVSPCSAALSCLLDNSSESVKMTVASSQVLLGIIPAILSYMGSEVLDLAVLSTHRPLLVLLLSAGAPALRVPDVFSALDVAAVVNRRPSTLVAAYYRWLWSLPKAWQRVLSCAVYAVAAGAVANNVHTSIYLDERSVVVFRCSSVYMPLAWAAIGCVPVAFSMAAVWQQYGLPAFPPVLPSGWWPRWKTSTASSPRDSVAEKSHRASLLTQVSYEAPGKWLSGLLFSMASLTALAQLFFGTAVLSALVPVSFYDALPIVVRYLVSSIVCRAILLLELDGLRARLQEEMQGRQ